MAIHILPLSIRFIVGYGIIELPYSNNDLASSRVQGPMPLSALRSTLVNTAPVVLTEGENLGHKKSP